MSPVFQRFRQDIRGIFWLGMASFVGLALYSFSPSDPSFNSTGHSISVSNYCGYFGSFLADLLFQIFGIVAWVLVAGCLRLSFLGFKGIEFSFRSLRALWAVFLILNLTSLLALYLPDQFYFDRQIFVGGAIGLMVAKGLVAVFNKMGVAVILWSFALILMVFYTERPMKDFLVLPMKLFRQVGEIMSKVFRAAGQKFKNLTEKMRRRIKGQGQKSSPEDRSSLEGDISVGRRLFSLKQPVSANSSNLEHSTELVEASPKRSFFKGWKLKRKEKVLDGAESEFEDDERESSLPKGFMALSGDEARADEDSPQETSSKRRKVKMSAKVQRKIENWELPKISLMEDPPANRIRIDEREIERKADLLVDKLAQFSVGGAIVGVKTGPAVTLFEFKPNADVKISKITELADDLSLALSAESVRIIAPIPGRDVVGIETSNTQRETVYLKDVVAERFFWLDDVKLPVPLGRQADGTPKVVDLRKMPHLLVAGTTGSGKSVFTVSTLSALLFKHSPKSLKLILIDPKQVDLAAFDRLPHLAMPLIRDPKKAVSALRWGIHEMEKRYRSMSKFGARGIESFNEIVSKLSSEEKERHEALNQEIQEDGRANDTYYYSPQPYVVIVVEEFGDLMAVDKQNVEQAVVRLAQMARASGIHLILAMQSPRKDVITGLIKTNIPGRISFKVASKMDSRIILDDAGAERLLARGDMLFLAPGVSKPERHHGPWLTEPEIDAVVNFWTNQGEPKYDDLAMRALEGSGGGFDLSSSAAEGAEEDEYDERYDEILSWVSSQKAVSASLLQRKFRLGYPRAARMIEIFECEGVVGPPNGSKPRKVLISSYTEP